MLIQGMSNYKRMQYLVDKYCSLLDNGVKAGDILVLLQNPVKKERFIEAFRSKIKIRHYENPQIHTFYGLCYNTVLNNWPLVEDTINIGNAVVTPNLTGLEISRLLLSRAIREADFKDYNSKINLLHQLFRRHSLVSNNNLTNDEIRKRSKILGESFGEEAQKALYVYKTKTVQYRAFDYLRQLNIFNYLYKNTDCFKDIKYLLVDDADEITPAEFEFVKHLKPQLKDFLITYDKHGSSRLGFLNTDTKTVERLEQLFKDEKTVVINDVVSPTVELAQASYSNRQEMIQKAIKTIGDLLESGASPDDISIVTPLVDSSLRFAINEFFGPKAVNVQFLSGSEKLSDTVLVKNCLTLLKYSIGMECDVFDIRSILTEILQIPLKYCLVFIDFYKKNQKIAYFDLGYDNYSAKLRELVETLDIISDENQSLSEKIYIVHEKLLSGSNSSCLLKENDYDKFLFFVKQIKDFEKVFPEYKTNTKFQKIVLNQISNSIISENPSDSPRIEENAIIVSTAQKIIDFSYSTKYQIWLDVTSHEWEHDDFGMLYNAWVFQNSWDKDSFTNEDNLEFSLLKTKKTLRKLALLAQNKIYTYSSMYDKLGAENIGRVEEILLEVCDKKKSSLANEKDIEFSFTPRDDQKPVLDYNGGKMAISAVPGAGKTTILLALIIKLLKQGVAGENIFVLTYMDSAARNFKDKIKNACPNMEKMPNISTIHGLALRILKENTNYARVGLDENFEVCDDAQRLKILREVVNYCLGDADDFDRYDRGISLLKLSNLNKTPYTKDAELLKFLKVYNSYNSALKSRNLIDYDDMLLYSVQILMQNPDIAQYYQNICQYIIEDEAQDSSAVQQKLLSILAEKHNNLIRCGDINQAITTTFTNTDLDGFRDFVNTSNNVLMTHSQRCTRDVYNLANRLVEFASADDIYKKAFFNVKMREVAGKNPVSSNAVISQIFADYNEERSYILQNVRKIFAQDKDASVAVLVRNNSQAEEFASYFSGFGYNIITSGESLEKQPVFNMMYSLLKFCSFPWQNETVINFAKTLCNQKLLKISEDDFSFLNDLKSSFILYNGDSLESIGLVQLLWDLNYWLENSALVSNVEDFVIKAGMYYYNTEVEKSNVYLTASFFKSVFSQYASVEPALHRLEEIKSRPLGQKYKYFESELASEAIQKGTIQVMTYHKSKGGEFDYVFIPALNEEYLQFKPENIKIKSKERFLEAVKSLNCNYKIKTENELKLFQIEENFRLLYVAITRAKKKLFITSSKNCKKFSRIKKTEPSLIFDNILNNVGEIHVR